MRTALATGLLAALVGCATDPGSDLDYSDADDTLADFAYSRSVTKVVQMNDVTVEGLITVADGERGGLLVKAPVVVLGVPETGTMNVSIRGDSVIGFVSDDLEFVVLAQDDKGEWNSLITARGEDDGEPFAFSTFDSLSYDAGTGELTVFTRDIAFDGYHAKASDLPRRIGIFAIPASTWGDLRGDYEFQIDADCNDQPCTAPARDIPGDPGMPSDPHIGDLVRTDKSLRPALPMQR